MVVEILGSRLFAPYFGSSTYVWSALIGVILASLSVGYYLGGRRADVNPSRKELSRILVLAGSSVAVIPFLAPYMAGLALLSGYRLGPLVYGVILFSLPSLLFGMVPPYTIKLATKDLKVVGSVAGDLYALSTVGSITGTLLSGFVLIPLFPVSWIFVGVTLLLYAVSLMVWAHSREILTGAAVAAIIAYACLQANAEEVYHQNETVVYERYTPYQRILVVDSADGNARTMRLDSSHSGSINLETGLTEYEYINFFELPFLLHPNITSVYMVGEGTGVGAAQITRGHPHVKVVVTEIDPTVHDVAVEYFGFSESDNVEVRLGDSRQLLKESGERYSLAIVDAFNSVYSIPTHLTTREFFAEVKKHLEDGGVVEVNALSTMDEQSMFLQSLCKTIQSEFRNVYIYGVDPSADKSRPQNVIMVASDRPLERPARDELTAYATPLFNETKLDWMLENSVGFDCSNGIVLADDYCPAEYLMEPVVEKAFA